MKNVSDKSCRETRERIFVQYFFSKNRAVCEIMWQKYFRAGQATDDNMAHVHSMLET